MQPLGLRFAPDISTASRATIGGMMANNSSGARSVLYGKTIDHVLEQTVVLSDGSIVALPRDPAQRGAQPATRSKPPATGRCCGWRAEHADEIDRRYPKILRRVGGYNLDEFTDPRQAGQPGQIMVGSEGTLGVVLEAKLRLVPLPKAKAVMVIDVRRPAGIARGRAGDPAPQAVGGRSDGQIDPRPHAPERGARPHPQRRSSRAIRRPRCASSSTRDRKEDLPPRLQALEAGSARAAASAMRYRAETDPAAQARIWSLREAALGLSMAMKDDAKSISFVEDTAVAPEKLRDYIERFLAIIHSHGTTAGRLRARLGGLPARPPGRSI